MLSPAQLAVTYAYALCGQAKGVRTTAGTWAASEAEARRIELSADRDEQWEASLVGKQRWLQRPMQPPGLLRSGMCPA